MDSTGELDVQSLFDGFEEIHDKVMRDVVTTERQHVFVILPVALHERDIEAFLLEKTFLDRSENGRFTGQADVADANRRRAAGGSIRLLPATSQKQDGYRRRCDQFLNRHVLCLLRDFVRRKQTWFLRISRIIFWLHRGNN